MACNVNSNMTEILCHDWKLNNFCNSSHASSTYTFEADVLKSRILFTNSSATFYIDKIKLINGTAINSSCLNGRLSTTCLAECNDFSLNDLLTKPSVDDSKVYGMYQFWIVLLAMACTQIGIGLLGTLGDTICLNLLGMYKKKF